MVDFSEVMEWERREKARLKRKREKKGALNTRLHDRDKAAYNKRKGGKRRRRRG